MDIRSLIKYLQPIIDRIQQMLSAGTVTLTDSSFEAQQVQAESFNGEPLDAMHHWEPYGLTSRPLVGAEALIGTLGGARSRAQVLMVGDRRWRVKNLEEGEVALYTDEGDLIHFKRNQEIVIDSGRQVTINGAETVNVNTADATITCSGKAVVDAAAIELAGADGDVVTTAHTCAYTGSPHPAGSSKVKAGM